MSTSPGSSLELPSQLAFHPWSVLRYNHEEVRRLLEQGLVRRSLQHRQSLDGKGGLLRLLAVLLGSPGPL